MTIPQIQDMMLPFLKFLENDKKPHLREVVSHLEEKFEITDEEKNQRLKSGGFRFKNRVAWAKTHLKHAGLISFPQRGFVKIEEAGISLLHDPPDRITIKFLQQYPDYIKFQQGSKVNGGSGKNGPGPTPPVTDVAPEEAIDSAYDQMRNILAEELLEKVISESPQFFEKLVVDLLVAMGYGGTHEDAGQVVGKSGDGGVDGLIKEDKLGLDTVCIQAKRWKGTVGSSTVREFAGSMEGYRAKKGVILTTSYYSKEANNFILNLEKKIVLIDGRQLAELMIDHNVGISTSKTIEIKKFDSDYFTEVE